MKLILFICALLPAISLAQSGIKFNNTEYYFGDSISSLNSIKACVGVYPYYYVSNTLVDHNLGQQIGLVKLDIAGVVLQKILFSDSLANLPTYPSNTLIADNNSDLLIVSNKNYRFYENWDGYVLKLNQNLDTLWTRVYAMDPVLAGCPPDTPHVENYFTAIKQTPDGGYILAGNYSMACTQGNQRSFLLKINNNGDVEWRKVYQDVSEVYNIELTSDSGFVFTDFFTGYAINKTDSLGNVIWKTDPNNLWNLRSSDLCVFGDDIIAACPYIYNNDLNNPYFGIDIVKLNSVGDIIWNKQYVIFQTFECPGLHQDFEVEALANGNILICGTALVRNKTQNKIGYKGVMILLDCSGDTLWSRYYNYGDFWDDCQFNDVVLCNDGGFLAVGYHFPYDGSYNAGAWLVKTDSNGYAPGSFPTGIEKPRAIVSSFNIYPNPAVDQAWIDLYDIHPQHKGGEIRIMDVAGSIVGYDSFPQAATRKELTTTHLKPGLYIVSILFKGGGMFTSKLVVR